MDLNKLLEHGSTNLNKLLLKPKFISHNDHSLFIRRTSRGCTIFLPYVDDIVINGNDVIGISDLKHYLMWMFRMKDLGVLTYFIGLEIQRTPLEFMFINVNILKISNPWLGSLIVDMLTHQ